ncbi:hypothetical protein BH09PSE5_BH09PSE5_05220 [soil metagenome]
MSVNNSWSDTDLGQGSGFRNSTQSHTPSGHSTNDGKSGSLREALTAGFRDRRRIALAFLLPFVATILLSFMPTPKYTSDASLLLRLGREYLYTPEVGNAGNATPMAYDREQTMRAEVEILMSRDINDAVLAKLGESAVYPAITQGDAPAQKQHDMAVLEMRRNLDAVLLKDSNVVHLSFTHPDPRVAASVLNTVIQVYLERRRSIFNTTSTEGPKAHVDSLRARLVETERQLDSLKRSRQIQSFGEQQSLLLAQRQSIEMKLDDSSLALAQSSARAGALKSNLASTPTDVVLSNETQRSEAVESGRKTLLDLRLKERDLSSKFTDNHPNVQDVRADIARTEAFLHELEARPNRTVRTGRSPVRDGVESDLVRSLADQGQASASRSTLLAQRDEVVGKLNRLAASQRQLETLERDRKMLEGSLESASRRLEDEIVNQRLDETRKSNVSVMQAAREPLEPRSIRGIVFAVGTLFSVACALLVAFVGALWRDTFVSPDEVERRLGLPLLAAVPRTNHG